MLGRFERLRELFDALIGCSPNDWQRRLAEVCPEDANLRSDVLALLRRAHAHAVEQPGEACPAAERPDPNLGRIVGPFRLTRLVGHGGMGNVYLGERCDGFKQQVAVKLVRKGVDTDDVLGRFRLERQLLAQLNHPHVARLIDGGETEDGSPYFAMEFVEAALPITDFCDDRTLTIRERLRLFASVCRAVHAAHQNTILHRDLKPSNILVDRGGAPKLVDFGIAKLLGADASVATRPSSAAAGFAPMTPEYASPEQVLGRPVTTASDVYALGVVLFELLVGQRPYPQVSRSDFDALRRAIVETPATRPSQAVANSRMPTAVPGASSLPSPEPGTLSAQRGTTIRFLRRQLSRELDTLVLHALNKEPQRRYASAEAMADDIDRFLAGDGIVAHPATVGYRVSTFVRRHKALVGGVLGTFLAILAGGITSFALYRKSEQEIAKSNSALELIDRSFGAVSAFGDSPTDTELADLLDVLADEAKRLEDAQPQVAARALCTVGKMYQMLDRFGEAKEALLQAAGLLEPILGSEHPEVLLTRVRAASADLSVGLTNVAGPVLESAVEQLRKATGVSPETMAEALTALGQYHVHTDSPAMGERLCREALSLLDANNARHNDELAGAWYVLGEIAYNRGDWAAARDAFATALPFARGAFGEFGTFTIVLTSNLATCYGQNGQSDAAVQLYTNLVPRAQAKLGHQPERLVEILNSAGVTLYYSGQTATAEKLYREAITLAESSLPAGHLQAALARYNLSHSLKNSKGGALPEAAPLLRAALPVMERENGEYDGAVLRGLLNLGTCL